MAGPGVSNAGSKPVAKFNSNDPALREAVVLGREGAARHSFRRHGILHAYSCTSTSTCSRVGLGAEGWGGVTVHGGGRQGGGERRRDVPAKKP